MSTKTKYTTIQRDSQKAHLARTLAEISLANPIIKIDQLCKAFNIPHTNVIWYKNQLKKGGDTK